MKYWAVGNYLKSHRKKSGLSLGDVGKLLGYKDPGQVSRHERGAIIPPLAAALAYEVVYRVPVAAIFAGMHEMIDHDVEKNLRELEAALEKRGADGPDANVIAQKLVWLRQRKSRS
jgi:transcriptional regulator with XRE-family HTH domain